MKWREFRIAVLPALVFAGTILAIVWIWRQHLIPVQVEQASKGAASTVVADTAKARTPGKS